MGGTIVGLISLLAGSFLVLAHRYFARFIVEQQNRFWGFHFGAREVKVAETVSIVVGLGFIAVGLLSLFQMIRFR